MDPKSKKKSLNELNKRGILFLKKPCIFEIFSWQLIKNLPV